MNLIVGIVLILIIFILYIILFVRKPDKYKNDPLHHFEDIKKNMKTGDIILFSQKKNDSIYKTIAYYTRTELIGCEYGHVGIIVRAKDKLYVLECVSNNHCADDKAIYINNFGQGGIRLIELEILLKEYDKIGDGLYAIKFISEELLNKSILDELKNYEDITFQSKIKLFYLGLIDVCISHNLSSMMIGKNNDKKIMCSGFVHHLLNKCGILKDYPSDLFWPHLIIYDDVFNSLENVKYSKPYRFKFSNPLQLLKSD